MTIKGAYHLYQNTDPWVYDESAQLVHKLTIEDNCLQTNNQAVSFLNKDAMITLETEQVKDI